MSSIRVNNIVKKTKLLKIIFGLLVIFGFVIKPAFSSEKNVTYMQILQNPNDLDLKVIMMAKLEQILNLE